MWFQLAVWVNTANRSLESERSIHMTPPRQVEFVGLKKKRKKERKDSRIEIPAVSSRPNVCIRSHSAWALWEAESRSDVTLWTLGPLNCHFIRWYWEKGRGLAVASPGRATLQLYHWRICRSSIRIGWFPVVFLPPAWLSVLLFISSSFPSFHSLPFSPASLLLWNHISIKEDKTPQELEVLFLIWISIVTFIQTFYV